MKKKNIRRAVGVSLLLAASLVIGLLCVPAKEGAVKAEARTIKVSEFDNLLMESCGLKKSVNNGEFEDEKEVTNEMAAYLINKADIEKNGKYDYDAMLHKLVIENKRISDISKATKEYRDSIYFVYAKGIMVGSSNGTYSTDRKFNPKALVTPKDAEKMISRLANKGKRYKLSCDGQVLRTTNKPKYASKYPYIIASLPNKFYEMKLQIYNADGSLDKDPGILVPKKLYSIEHLGDLGIPAETAIQCNSASWKKNVGSYLNTVFSYDYKKTFSKTFKKNILKQIWIPEGDSSYKKKISKDVDTYLKNAKKEKVRMKVKSIVVEPSTVYNGLGGDYIRCAVTFKISAKHKYTAKSLKQNRLIFSPASAGGETLLKGMEKYINKGKYYTVILDMNVANQGEHLCSLTKTLVPQGGLLWYY